MMMKKDKLSPGRQKATSKTIRLDLVAFASSVNKSNVIFLKEILFYYWMPSESYACTNNKLNLMALWPSFSNFCSIFLEISAEVAGRQVWDYIKEVIDWLTRFLVDNIFYSIAGFSTLLWSHPRWHSQISYLIPESILLFHRFQSSKEYGKEVISQFLGYNFRIQEFAYVRLVNDELVVYA